MGQDDLKPEGIGRTGRMGGEAYDDDVEGHAGRKQLAWRSPMVPLASSWAPLTTTTSRATPPASSSAWRSRWCRSQQLGAADDDDVEGHAGRKQLGVAKQPRCRSQAAGALTTTTSRAHAARKQLGVARARWCRSQAAGRR